MKNFYTVVGGVVILGMCGYGFIIGNISFGEMLFFAAIGFIGIAAAYVTTPKSGAKNGN